MGTDDTLPPPSVNEGGRSSGASSKAKTKGRDTDTSNAKRRCVSTACIACRKRKSKCDGNLPSCAACSSVYGTECVYDPNSDHRRKGVYKKDIDSLKTRNTTLQTLIHGILNYTEQEALDLVREIRACDNLDDVAEAMLARENAGSIDGDEAASASEPESENSAPRFEKVLAGKMGELRLETDAIRFIGGTSNLLYDDSTLMSPVGTPPVPATQQYLRQEDAVRSWTTVTGDVELIIHLLNMYFTWHYTYFTTLSKYMFFQDFFRGKPISSRRSNEYCTPLLVNAMLTLGCHFTSWPAARANPRDAATAGDHFFKEAKRWFVENDEYETPRLATVQALALMSVREAGCGREPKGWVYSGMSFRMACDLGLTVRSEHSDLDEHEIDARRITLWGCFLFDKCWSNYLGRAPQLPLSSINVPKFDVFPSEDADIWSPWTDTGLDQSAAQPSRTRAVALMVSTLCEVSSDILLTFYRPSADEKKKGKQAEIKRLSELHTQLEAWRKDVPREMDPREGQLPHVLVMHMFFNLLFIHLFRPFLKYSQHHGPLPPNVQPRRICTQAAGMISKLLRLYKRTHGLRQVCNIVVYMVHSACTIHLLHLPDKEAKRDIVHSARALEEITDSWLCARRTLLTLGAQARKWKIDLPSEAAVVFQRAEEKYGGNFSPSQLSSDPPTSPVATSPATTSFRHGNPPMPRALPRNENVLHVKTGPESLATVPSFSTYGPPHSLGSAGAELASPQSTSIRSDVAHSPTSVLTGSYQSFEDSKDWWLKDQSSIFDQWAGADGQSLRSAVGTGPPASGAWDPAAAMMTLQSNDHAPSDDERATSEEYARDGSGPMYGLDYLDFTPGNHIYGYPRGGGA